MSGVFGQSKGWKWSASWDLVHIRLGLFGIGGVGGDGRWRVGDWLVALCLDWRGSDPLLNGRNLLVAR